jgi:hypothetical protein
MDLKINISNISVKNWLLLDGIGAIVTAIMCLVIGHFESFFGMPKSIMFVMSGFAFCFAGFSLSCFAFVKNKFKKYLRTIIKANIIYGIAIFILVTLHIERLTGIGIIYFAGEIIIITLLVYSEYNKVKKGNKE